MKFILKGTMNENEIDSEKENREEKETEYLILSGIVWAFITFLSLAYSFAIHGFYPLFVISELGVGIPILIGKILGGQTEH